MSDLIPFRTPANTWRGFALRVAVVALAALAVLAVASFFGWNFDILESHPRTFPVRTESDPHL